MNEAQRRSFLQGTETRAYRFMGCHRDTGSAGYVFRVWAPNAKSVHVAGSFNDWNQMPMWRLDGGIFEVFTKDAQEFDQYQYLIETESGELCRKADPYGFYMTQDGMSCICTIDGYTWNDGTYRRAQARKKLMQNPIHIYELHPGSWKRREDGSPYTYAELSAELVPYLTEMGYTHVELMAVAAHTDSVGYQVIGFYAPNAAYGTPADLMAFVDTCHRAGIGVLMNWIPGHFSQAEEGLSEFDGTPCYELSESLRHPRWDTRMFDHGRYEVQSFLISNAVYWVDEYHLDGLRIDEVAFMLYPDFEDTTWRPSGEPQNPDAIVFLQRLNQTIRSLRTNVIMAAEESSAYPNVTGMTEDGGLGFTMKWNTDWTSDLCEYILMDPVYRKYHHEHLTYAMEYAYTENFILPLSRDASVIEQIPGFYDDKFANLRTLYGFQMSHPGKKLNFMGNEIAQFTEWDAEKPLEWFVTEFDRHSQMQRWMKDLNHYYLNCKALWQTDGEPAGFQWLEANDPERSVLAYRRVDRKGKEVVVVCNFCPVLWDHYRIGLAKKGCYIPVLCSDSLIYGGNDVLLRAVRSEPLPNNGLKYSAEFTIPPLSITFYEME